MKKESAYQPARVYDLENHTYSPEFMDYMHTTKNYPYMVGDTLFEREGVPLPFSSEYSFNSHPGGLSEEIRDIGDVRLGIMDKAGVTTAILSMNNGVEEMEKTEKEKAVRFARNMNDAFAEAVAKYPGRYLGTMALPAPHVEESIAELERCVKELGLQYWLTHSNYGYGGERLSDPKFEPLLAKCEELDVAIYIHPNFPVTDYLLDSGTAFTCAGFGFSVDTMKTALNLIINGTFDRHPNLKIILGHIGEFFPYALDRMDNRFGAVKDFDPVQKCKKSISCYFKNNFYVTTSGITQEDTVLLALKVLGSDRILFGSDYPYENVKEQIDFINSLPVCDEIKDKIFYKNTENYIIKDRS
ncbi:MAG TPA: amidohydrolase family protein [Methanocorpusculum sp.]|nr:amidohydrolase family protein [Methanocorpusculum sp.]